MSNRVDWWGRRRYGEEGEVWGGGWEEGERRVGNGEEGEKDLE